MKRIAIIPARGGSKGINKKNIIKLKDKPLIAYTIEAAIMSASFDSIFVNTDSDEISEVCKKYSDSVKIYKRSSELSEDTTPIIEVLKEFVQTNMYNIEAATSLALLQCTSPLRNAYDIRGAYELWDRYKPESLVSVVKIPHSMNPEAIHDF